MIINPGMEWILQCTNICSIMAQAWEKKKKNEDKLSTQQVWSCLPVLRLSEAVKFFMGELEFEWGTSCRYVHLCECQRLFI